jgi:hypothetical protein
LALRLKALQPVDIFYLNFSLIFMQDSGNSWSPQLAIFAAATIVAGWSRLPLFEL